jgi:hypothetical protein
MSEDTPEVSRYCSTCREYFVATTSSPPYAAVHVISKNEWDYHVDPITRERIWN